jgi:hypothetical protein
MLSNKQRFENRLIERLQIIMILPHLGRGAHLLRLSYKPPRPRHTVSHRRPFDTTPASAMPGATGIDVHSNIHRLAGHERAAIRTHTA